MKRMLIVSTMLLSGAAWSSDLSWPADFDSQVAAREAAVRPRGETGLVSGIDLIGGDRKPSAAAGSVENPFDSWRFFSSVSEGVPFSTTGVGFLLFL